MKKLYFDRIEWTNDKGEPHRLDGPAIEWSSGDKVWLQNGNLHRVDGPAIEWNNGNKEWWFNGKQHRVDGPALELSNGDKHWYRKGKYFSSEEEWFKALTKGERLDYLFNME